MKLLRFGAPGQEKPAILDQEGQIRDISQHIDDIDGSALGRTSLDHFQAIDLSLCPVVADNSRIGPCVNKVGKFICIGLNYHDHARETGAKIPAEPIVFFKATSAITGPNDGIQIPRGSQATDWEVELGVVIGEKASYIDEAEALDYVAGYCLVNDVSERDFQLKHSGQWVKGKSADTFGPIGPWLVTKDEIENPGDIALELKVNGKIYQSASTQNMVFNVAFIVAYLSRFMSLHPGDIISTGTPAGVGMGQKPDPVYLKPGDTVALSGQGLGSQTQQVF